MRSLRVLFAVLLLAAAGTATQKGSTAADSEEAEAPSWSVAIVPFQDFSHSSQAAQLREVLARHIQFLLVSNTNFNPRVVTDEAGTVEAAVAIGRAQKTDLVLMGTVLAAEVEEKESGVGGIGFGGVTVGGKNKSQDAVVSLQADIIDVAHGKRLKMFRVSGNHREEKMAATSLGTGHGNLDLGSPEFRRSALGKATQKALDQLMAKFLAAANSYEPPAEAKLVAASESTPVEAPSADSQPAAAEPAPAATPAGCNVTLKVIGPGKTPVRAYTVQVNGTDMSSGVRSGVLHVENPTTPIEAAVTLKAPLPGTQNTSFSDKLDLKCTKPEEVLVLEIDRKGNGAFWWE